VKRCGSQERIIKGTRETKVMEKEIEQLSDEIKRKGVNIVILKEELTRTKKEATRALEEVKEAEVLKCKEIIILENKVADFIGKSGSLGDEVAKLNVEMASKDSKLKDTQSTLISMINSKLEREETNQSLRSQVQLLHSSVDKLKREHSKKVAALKIEIDEIKMCPENEAVDFQENVVELEQLAKIAAVKDETIEQQRGYCTEMENVLAERACITERIQQDLKMREREVSALVKRCGSQERIIKGTRETKVMEKEIEQLSDEIKRKGVNIVILKEELTRTKKEATRALEEVKEAEVLKCKEIIILENKVADFIGKSGSLGDEVAKLNVEMASKDSKLKDTQSTLISMINSKLEREETNQSFHSQVQLLHSSVLKIEINQLKTRSENEAITFKQKVTELEHLAKITAVKDETIEQQKGYCTEMGKELTERELLINEMAHQKVELEDELKDSQLRLQEIQVLFPSIDNSKSDDSKSDDLKSDDSDKGTDFKTPKTALDAKRTTFSRMLSDLNTMRKIANEKDEIIKQKNTCCSDMEMELTEKLLIINETVQQKKELEDDLRQTRSLAMELEESPLCLREINRKVAELKKQEAKYVEQQKPKLLSKEKSPKKKLKHSRLKKLSSKILRAKASQLIPSFGSTKVMTMNSVQLKLSALDNDDGDTDGGEESKEA